MNDCTAFAGSRRIASGPLAEVARRAAAHLARDPHAQILIFDNVTSEPVEVDLRLAEPVAEAAPEEVRRPVGRPKLGVVAREVTLLPRHWEWLAGQPGGASVALRKLVEHAMRANRERDRVRRAREAVYRFVTAVAGNEPGYEEALRALFAGDRARFGAEIAVWPKDIRAHTEFLAAAAFETNEC